MAIYLSFLVPKITAIVHATPTNARPTPSAWNHEHDRLSDFVPTVSLLKWQWRNGQFYHPSRNGASRTTQCQEIPHLLPEPFYPVLQAQVGEFTPPPHLSLCFHQKFVQVQQILERPSERGRLHQVQIRSYRNRQSGNLARKVRNAFPGSEALCVIEV